MSEIEREALAQRVKIALEFFNTARVTITAPVPTEIKLPAGSGEADKSIAQTKEEGEDEEGQVKFPSKSLCLRKGVLLEAKVL
jgi:hypothetical protein